MSVIVYMILTYMHINVIVILIGVENVYKRIRLFE